MLEVVVVVLLIAVTLAIASQSYGFSLARTAALRDRTPAAVVFLEGERRYLVRSGSGDVVVQRDYGAGSDVRLSLIDLELAGDSLSFNGRGIADLSGASGPLGLARFVAGRTEYVVTFNSMGASAIQQP
jgi:hypothetical protein